MFWKIKSYFEEKRLNKRLNEFVDELEFYWYSFKKFDDVKETVELVNPIGEVEQFSYKEVWNDNHLEEFIDNLDLKIESVLKEKGYSLVDTESCLFKNKKSWLIYFKVLNNQLEELLLSPSQILWNL